MDPDESTRVRISLLTLGFNIHTRASKYSMSELFWRESVREKGFVWGTTIVAVGWNWAWSGVEWGYACMRMPCPDQFIFRLHAYLFYAPKQSSHPSAVQQVNCIPIEPPASRSVCSMNRAGRVGRAGRAGRAGQAIPSPTKSGQDRPEQRRETQSYAQWKLGISPHGSTPKRACREAANITP